MEFPFLHDHLASLNLTLKSQGTEGQVLESLRFSDFVSYVSPYSGALWYIGKLEDGSQSITIEYYT
jgi:hypothetical protein